MKSFVAMLRKNFLGISEDEVTFARREFPGALSGPGVVLDEGHVWHL